MRSSKGASYNFIEIPFEYKDIAEEYRERLIESLCDVDDAIMEAYLAGKEIGNDAIKTAIKKGTLLGLVTPVLCGSAFKNKGVQPMLDAVVDYLPSPVEVGAIKGKTVSGEEDEPQSQG